jgi:hypothetical protein
MSRGERHLVAARSGCIELWHETDRFLAELARGVATALRERSQFEPLPQAIADW